MTDRTISDFGEQWTHYRTNAGYFGSVDLLEDFLAPLLPLAEIRGARVGDVGSGNGRIVEMLLAAGAAKVVAVEPSDAFFVLQENTRAHAQRIEYVHGTGDALPGRGDLDIVVSIGVLHHIPEPRPVVEQAYRALRPGGKFLAWIYGHEGNELYLGVAEPLRRLTTRIPHPLLVALTWALYPALRGYALACARLPLPMAAYMHRVIAPLSGQAARLVIYDQLNPGYAKYYRRDEAMELFSWIFDRVELHHRHGYSWTILGHKAA